MYPYNHKRGQTIQTDVDGVTNDRAFLAHFQVAAASAVAASNTGVLANTALGASAADITEGVTNPAIPRCLSVKGSESGITGDVVITGTNYANEEIEETFALNGETVVDGAKAFKTVTNIHTPAKTHTATLQQETATVVGTIEAAGAGNAAVVVTAAGMTGSPKTIAVAVANNDDAAAVAGKIRTALAADSAVAAKFTVSGATDKVILTKKVVADNDTTLNISIDNGTCAGLTTAASSENTTAGVDTDFVSVGWNDKLGLKDKLPCNTVLFAALGNVREGTAPTVTTSATAIESNTIDLNSALDGSVVDVYLIV